MAPRLRVTIVIPVHNEADMIGPCLDAVLGQRVAADEVIVVDNNSTNATAERLSAYEGRIRVVREARQGVQFARTAGFDAASGDVIGRIDADTRLPAGWVEGLHAVFARPGVRGVTGPIAYYDIALPRLVAAADLLLRRAWVRTGGPRLDWIYGANMAIRADAWRAVRETLCHDRLVHEDHDLGIHLYAAGQAVVFAPELTAATSSRRIRDSPRDFRAYLRMTELGCKRHAVLVQKNAFLRAWVTGRILLVLFPPLRVLHFLHHRGGRRPAAARRRNPMSA